MSNKWRIQDFWDFVQDGTTNKVLAYLLQRYLGKFLEQKLTSDQLDVSFSNGTGTLINISLDITYLNELAEQYNWPIEFLDGTIDKLHIKIPWTSLLQCRTDLEITGLNITIQPKQRFQSAPTSMLESMWSSISTSVQLAHEFAKQKEGSPSYEGMDSFAQKIDAALSRVKVKCIDTTIHVEYVPENSSNGVGMVIHMDLIEYSDEAGKDPTKEESTKFSNQDPKKANFTQSMTSKLFDVRDVTFSTIEFSSKNRTIPEHEDDGLVDLIEGSTSGEDSEDAEYYSDDNTPVQEGHKKFKDGQDMNEPSHAKNGHHAVVFATLSGSQEIRLSLKQSEDSGGLKMSLVANLGVLALFLSPRQVHLLVELANGFSSADMESKSDPAPRSKCATKPLSTFDQQTVEESLLQRMQSPYMRHGFPLRGLQGDGGGWSAADQGENDTDDMFLPMDSALSGMYESALSGISSSMASSISSSTASSVTELSFRTKRRISNLDSDPTAEISHFEIKIATLAMVLLHEDLLVQSIESDQVLLSSSVQEMQQTSEEFFEAFRYFVVSESEAENLKNASTNIDQACHLSHLRLLAATVELGGIQKVTSSSFSVIGQLTTAKLELNEYSLIDVMEGLEQIPILQFVEIAPEDSEKSCLTVSFKHVEKTSRNMIRKGSGPRTDISVLLTRCNLEVDVTIIDRLSALLSSPTICIIEKSSWNSRTTGTVPMTLPTITEVESRMDLKLTCPKLNVKLRFPVPDFRPASSMDRAHWWERNVRPDFLSLLFTDILMQTTFQTEQSFREYSLQSKGLDIYYSENDKHTPHHLAKAYCDGSSLTPMDDMFLQNRLSIKIFPVKNTDLEECSEPEPDPMMQSCYGAFEKQIRRDSGPFCSRRVVHHSNNPHPKHKSESSELLLPGEKHEIDEFIKSTSSSSKIQIEISLPMLSAQLRSKHIFEVLYNRINNDLLLWKPSAPKQKTNPYNYKTQWMTRDDGQNIYGMCASAGLFNGPESESDDESDIPTYFRSTNDKQMNQSKNEDFTVNEQSEFTLSLEIGKGTVCMNPPVRDSASNVIPGQQGEFIFNIEDATIFLVSGYKGNQDLGYVCVQSHSAGLFHCDMQTIPVKIPPLKEIGSIVGKHLLPTIYKSEAGVLAASKNRGEDRETLTVAIRIRDNYTVTRDETVVDDAKNIQVSVGLNKCTLRHRMLQEPNSWISHMLDFFNLTDYPIPNYVAKEVLTEIDLHLWDCAIDYRPLHLPIRTVLTMGTFSIRSNMSIETNSSLVTFIFEECVLFLSERGGPRQGVASSVPVHLKQDYFSVADLGLFEISLKTNDKVTAGNPRIDLRISNNILNITTCADSGKMLIDLLQYLCNEGDLSHSPPETDSSPFSTPKHYVEQELVKLQPQNTCDLTRSQQDRIRDELLDAMEDILEVEETSTSPAEAPPKLFLFPGESRPSHPPEERPPPPRDRRYYQRDQQTKPNPLVARELGDICSYRHCLRVDLEKEHKFLANEPVPEIKWLTADPVRVVNDHFYQPEGKVDVLEPPKTYPQAVVRYALREMSVVWHIYGGNDFEGKNKKKGVNFSDKQTSAGVSYARSDSMPASNDLGDRQKEIPWLRKGGVNRRQDFRMEFHLNRVRFLYELYPETTVQASRLVLTITEFSVTDRLECSEINKFLYLYTSETRPKQSRAHMLVVKALYIRPDTRLNVQECCLKVSMLPLRFNIDQDALLFLINFFCELGDGSSNGNERSSSKPSTPTQQLPIMTLGRENEDVKLKEAVLKTVEENLIMLESRYQEPESPSSSVPSSLPDDSPTYIRNFEFSPEVMIKIDYHGKRVDFTHGPLPGLFLGLMQLDSCHLTLKTLSNKRGISGFERLVAYIVHEFLSDVKNQLLSLLSGVGPMYALLQLVQGFKDLIWMPIEQYRKDGRIVRGLQRGTHSFKLSTARATLDLADRLVRLIQAAAETAYDILTPGPGLKTLAITKKKKKRHSQPQDIREGVSNALAIVRDGIGETASNLVHVATHEKEQKGYSGAVGGVLREIPSTMVKPILFVAGATTDFIGGVRNQMVPDARMEANQKWRNDFS